MSRVATDPAVVANRGRIEDLLGPGRGVRRVHYPNMFSEGWTPVIRVFLLARSTRL